MMLRRDTVLDLLGVPYAIGGRDPDCGGLDCLGLVLEALRREGIQLADPWEAIAGRFADGWRDFGELAPAGWDRIDPHPKIGWPAPLPVLPRDVLVLGAGGTPTGIGIAVDRWYGLHTAPAGEHFGAPGVAGVSRLVKHDDVRRRLLWIWRLPA